jgi:uncharacterized protein (TIGR02145 family)
VLTIFACSTKKHKDISMGSFGSDSSSLNEEVSSSSSENVSSSSIDLCEGFVKDTTKFCDSRDGKKYTYKKIGNQTWMAENLNYEVEGSKCYDNKQENCVKYGRLYNWETAINACPEDWHLPKYTEWDTLLTTIGEKMSGKNAAGRKLKAKNGWNRRNNGRDGNGIDDYGFSALPGGAHYRDDERIDGIGRYGFFWTATDEWSSITNDNSYIAYRTGFWNDDSSMQKSINLKSSLFSVRCVYERLDIPLTLNDCYTALDKLLESEIKDDIRNGLLKVTLKVTLEKWILNNWIYPTKGKSRIAKILYENGVKDTDDMPLAIIIGYHYYLNGTEKKIKDIIK